MAEPKKQNYLHGAAIMTVTTIVVKIIAFAYKIPLGSMSLLGDEGYAHFIVAYNIYAFFLTLATAGFPVALSRMITEADTLHRPAQVQRIFRVSFTVLFSIGAVFTLIMLVFNQPLARIMGDTEANWSIVALAPAVVIVCMTSAFRGYCQGLKNMIPTAFGQIIEESGKLVIGLVLAWILIRQGKDLSIASGGAIFGVTAGAAGALIYMYLYKRRNYPVMPYGIDDVPDSRRSTLRSFLAIAIPIAIGSTVLSLVNLLDNGLCLNRLQSAAGFSSTEAHVLYGAYGKAQTFYNLPSYFITPLTLTIVPAVASALTEKNRLEASKMAETALRITAVVALPMSVGLGVLAGPIYKTIYWGSHEVGPQLLRSLSPGAFFVCMAMISNSILQGIHRERIPVLGIAVGGAIKIGINWFLVGNPQLNINGAPVGSLCCFLVVCIMDYFFLCKTLEKRPRLSVIFVGPAISSAVMGVAAWAANGLVYRFIFHEAASRTAMAVSLVAGLVTAVVVYAVMLGVTKAVTLEDMAMIPKGEKVGKVLHLKKSDQ